MNAQCHGELFAVPGHFGVFSPDGATLAAWGWEEVVKLYDAWTGKEVLALKGLSPHLPPAFSHDGARIAVSTKDGMVKVHDVRTGKEVLALNGMSWPTFDSGGTRIAALGNDGTVRVFDAGTGHETLNIKGTPRLGPPTFSPDGNRIAASDEKMVRLYDARTAKEVLSVAGMTAKDANLFGLVLDPVVFSPNGALLAVLDLDGGMLVRLYDARTGKETFSHKDQMVYPPAMSPDGARIAPWFGLKGEVQIQDARSGKRLLALKGPAGLYAPEFSPDGAQVAATTIGRLVTVHDTSTGAELFALRGATARGNLRFSPDGSRIASLGQEKEIKLFDARDAEVLPLPGKSSTNPVLSPDGERFAIPEDQGVKVHDLRTGAVVSSLTRSARLSSLVFSQDGSRLAGSDAEGKVRVFDSRTGAEILALKGSSPLSSPVFSRDGTRMAASSKDRAIQVFDARTGAEIQSIKRRSPGHRLMFSPDGSRIAAVGSRGLEVYDAQSGQECLSIDADLMGLLLPVYSPDGNRIAVGQQPGGGSDGSVWIYDARTAKEILKITGRGRTYNSPVFSPDGTRIAIISMSGVIHIYDASTGQEALPLKLKGDPLSFGTPVFSPDGAKLLVVSRNQAQVFQAPGDVTTWRSERLGALKDRLPLWRRTRAVESEQLGQWFSAEFHWKRLGEGDSTSGYAPFRRGLALANLGRGAEAKTAFELALRLKKELDEIDLADVHCMLGQWNDAATRLARAVDLPTASVNTWMKHGLVRLRQNDPAGYRSACARMVDRFAKARPREVVIDMARACAAGEKSLPDWKRVVELAQAAVRADGDDPDLHNALAAVLFRAGREKEAIPELMQAIKRREAGGAWPDFLFLAMAHHRLGHQDEARRWLSQAMQSGENLPPAPWTDRVQFDLLSREAESLVQPAAKDAKK